MFIVVLRGLLTQVEPAENSKPTCGPLQRHPRLAICAFYRLELVLDRLEFHTAIERSRAPYVRDQLLTSFLQSWNWPNSSTALLHGGCSIEKADRSQGLGKPHEDFILPLSNDPVHFIAMLTFVISYLEFSDSRLPTSGCIL